LDKYQANVHRYLPHELEKESQEPPQNRIDTPLLLLYSLSIGGHRNPFDRLDFKMVVNRYGKCALCGVVIEEGRQIEPFGNCCSDCIKQLGKEIK